MRWITLLFAVAGTSPSEPFALYDAGEYEHALAHLDTTTTDDPGQVAFLQGLALAKLGRTRDAELRFERVLSDDSIPAHRRDAAWYNLGLCRMARTDGLRGSIDAFRACRDATTDAVLKADAEHNLELAKLRWLASRVKQNDSPKDVEHTQGPTASKTETVAGPNESPGPKSTEPPKATDTQTVNGTPKDAATKVAGAGTLPVIRDTATLTPMTAEDTQSHLDGIAERLKKQRRSIDTERAGPDRPGVKDW